MSTRAIRTSSVYSACDVCGRTLLRGEQADIYLDGATRHSVCELCTSRALHGGWIREGSVREYGQPSARDDHRGSLLGRWRTRRAQDDPPPIDDLPAEPDDGDRYGPAEPEPGARAQTPARGPSRGRSLSRRSRPAQDERQEAPGREPRHVRAVPTSIEHKIASAVAMFNASEHPRRIAGIARSLGLPDVSVHPTDATGTTVNVVVAWELCWYRFEVDLSDELPSVRAAGQGYELSELTAPEREINAAANARGMLGLDS